MDKIVKNNPHTNVEVLQNLAFIRYGEVWIRGGSIDGDCTLVDFINRACSEHRCELATDLKKLGHDFENVGEMLMDCSEEGCPIGTLYYVACQAAELREYLRIYEEGVDRLLTDEPKENKKDGEQE